MLSRETVLEVCEIICGNQSLPEETVVSYMLEKDTVALRKRVLLERRGDNLSLQDCCWGEKTVTRHDIVMGYMYLLGRAPSGENAIKYLLSKKMSRQQYFTSVIESYEFKIKYHIMLSENDRKYFWDTCLSYDESGIFNDVWNYSD